jgi:hypothetical protein
MEREHRRLVAGCGAFVVPALWAYWIFADEPPQSYLPRPAPAATAPIETPPSTDPVEVFPGAVPSNTSQRDYREAMEVLAAQGSVLEGSVLDARASGHPLMVEPTPPRPAADIGDACELAEQLLRTARLLDEHAIDGHSSALSLQMRQEALRYLQAALSKTAAMPVNISH